MHRFIGGLLTLGLTVSLSMSAPQTPNWQPTALEPYITPLDLHPADMAPQTSQAVIASMPMVVRQGHAAIPDQRQIQVPVVVTPSQRPEDQGVADGKAGTGFFIGDDGTLLTAAHVANGCGRMQIISKYVPRTWVSLVASDTEHDVAVLKAPGLRSPAVVHLASVAPTSGKLFLLGFPASAGLTIPAEAWAVLENAKFPPNVGSLANPRDLLWMSAPAVAHGYSGGPVFDPRSGAVVGMIKGQVDGGYLRLVRDMPTTGVAIGPGVNSLAEMVRRQVPYSAVSLVSSPGEAGVDTLRRATVHVLCWH